MYHIPAITFNLVLFSLVGGLSVLGFFFGENRLKFVSYGAFVAFFILLVSSESTLTDIASKTNLPIATAKLGFVAVICVLSFLGALLDQKKARNKIRSIFLGIITALFITGYGVALLPASAQKTLVTDFNLAAQVDNFRLYFMLATAVWLIIIQFIPNKKDDEKHK